MKKQVRKAIRILLFFIIGVVIFWVIYKDQDINRIKLVLKNDVNYFWVWVSIVLGVFSHISRSIRWNYLLEPMGVKPRLLNTFLAVMVGYLMNLVVPRMGELSRCGVLAKYEKISFARLIGTVITERIFDMLVLFLLTIVVIVSQLGHVMRMLRQNPEIESRVLSVFSSPWLFIGVASVLLILFLLRKKIRASRIYRKMETTVSHFREGLMSVRYIKRKGAFIFHSLLIWALYYLMLYSAFFAFDFTSGLSPVAGLTTFVMASYGMVAPVQGGIGAWHFMTKESLALYGVANENGIIFAFLAHSTMTLMIIVLGLFSLLALPFVNRRDD